MRVRERKGELISRLTECGSYLRGQVGDSSALLGGRTRRGEVSTPPAVTSSAHFAHDSMSTELAKSQPALAPSLLGARNESWRAKRELASRYLGEGRGRGGAR